MQVQKGNFFMEQGLAYFINDNSLELREITIEPLKKGFVRVEVKCTGVNRADILQVKGLYPAARDYGPIPGLEFSGVVLDSNETNKNWTPNSKVIGLVESGAYSSVIDVLESSLIECNTLLSLEELACIPESYSTAYLNLVLLGQINQASRVLVYSAAGGVGLSALHIIRSIGAKGVAVIGSDKKREYLEKLGFSDTINYKEKLFQDFIQYNKSAFSHILDSVGGSNLSINSEMLSYQGNLLLIGLLGGAKAEIDLRQILAKNISIRASTLRTQALTTKELLLDYIQNVVLPGMGHNPSQFYPCLDSVFSYKAVNDAFEHMIQSKNAGNIVLKWDID